MFDSFAMQKQWNAMNESFPSEEGESAEHDQLLFEHRWLHNEHQWFFFLFCNVQLYTMTKEAIKTSFSTALLPIHGNQ